MRKLSDMTEQESIEIGVWHYWHVLQNSPELWKIQFYTLRQISELVKRDFDITP